MIELRRKWNESKRNTNVWCYWTHPSTGKHLLADKDIPLPSCQENSFWRPGTTRFWHENQEFEVTFYHDSTVESVTLL